MRRNLATRTRQLASEILADFRSVRATEGQRRKNSAPLTGLGVGRRNVWTYSGNRDIHLPAHTTERLPPARAA
jgi:hypothetical protein